MTLRPLRRARVETVLRAFVALPLVALKIIAAIHWDARRLWIKGVKLIPRLRAANANEPTTSLASGKSRAYIP